MQSIDQYLPNRILRLTFSHFFIYSNAPFKFQHHYNLRSTPVEKTFQRYSQSLSVDMHKSVKHTLFDALLNCLSAMSAVTVTYKNKKLLNLEVSVHILKQSTALQGSPPNLYYVEGAKVRNTGTYKDYDLQISTLFDEFHNLLCVNSDYYEWLADYFRSKLVDKDTERGHVTDDAKRVEIVKSVTEVIFAKY